MDPAETFISSLAGKFTTLQTSQTLNTKHYGYIYERRLILRRPHQNDPNLHEVQCTHCSSKIWEVPASRTTTSQFLRHFRSKHPLLPLSMDEEKEKIEQLLGSSESNGNKRRTPFDI